MHDPIARFQEWFFEAQQHFSLEEASAMSLATADEKGRPSVRIVLLKSADSQGFTFYTNMNSRKAKELRSHPQAALCFYWPPLARQIRIEGRVEPVSDAEADAYFATRPRISQIGAWASQQSEALASRDMLLRAVDDVTARYEGRDVPRPPHWSGWRLVPDRMEFWQGQEFRLHDRDYYTRGADEQWQVRKLYP